MTPKNLGNIDHEEFDENSVPTGVGIWGTERSRRSLVANLVGGQSSTSGSTEEHSGYKRNSVVSFNASIYTNDFDEITNQVLR